MKILHVLASGQRRGAETFAADLVHEIERDGWTQAVALVRGRPQEIVFDVPTHALTRSGRRRGVRPLAAIRLRSLVRELAPDVVQAHGGEALKYAVLAAPPTSIVYRRIGGSPASMHRRPRRAFYSKSMRLISRVVTVADTLRRETMLEFDLEPDQVVTIPNGVDRDRIAPTKSRDEVREALGVDRTAPLLLSVGALSWEKDPHVHLEVARRLAADRPGLVHLMAGDGPLRDEVAAAAAASGVTELLGPCSDVGNLMAASDVLLFASRLDGMEGMPAVAIEAAMLGIPFAGYDVAGVGEVVAFCGSGILVDHGDVVALTAAARRLLDDRRLVDKIRADAPTHAKAFDIATVAAQYRVLYEEVASSR